MSVIVIICPNCNGALNFEPGTEWAFCKYCDSVLHMVGSNKTQAELCDNTVKLLIAQARSKTVVVFILCSVLVGLWSLLVHLGVLITWGEAAADDELVYLVIGWFLMGIAPSILSVFLFVLGILSLKKKGAAQQKLREMGLYK